MKKRPTNLFITYKCNWNCSYCITSTHDQPDVNFDDILKQASEIEEYSAVDISGGEPGLVSYENLKKLLKILTDKCCYIRLFTNGEFFKHKTLISDIHSIIYHCSENLDDIVKPVHYKNVAYIIVISERNKHNFDSFITNNSHILFSVSSAYINDSLNKIEGIKIWLKYKDKIHINSRRNLMYSKR